MNSRLQTPNLKRSSQLMTQAQTLLGIGPGTKFNPIQALEIEDSDDDLNQESLFGSNKFGDVNEQEIS